MQKFGVCNIFERRLSCSPRLHLKKEKRLFINQITLVVLYECWLCWYTVFLSHQIQFRLQTQIHNSNKMWFLLTWLWWCSSAETWFRKHWLECYVISRCFCTDDRIVHLWQIISQLKFLSFVMFLLHLIIQNESEFPTLSHDQFIWICTSE